MYVDPRTPAAYDLIHRERGKDYAIEARQVAAMVRRLRPGAHALLDVACGTGLHLDAFADLGFDVTGVDVSPVMLDAARRRRRDATLHEGDMRSFALDQRFDVVTCLFSSIAFMTDREQLDRAIGNMVGHLRPHGVLVVEPWVQPEDWEVGVVDADAANDAEIAVAKVTRTDKDGEVGVLAMHYLTATADGVGRFDEEHRLGLFHDEELADALQEAGLAVHHDFPGITGRGLFLGIR
jgi:SAM-dependent methyltransferase